MKKGRKYLIATLCMLGMGLILSLGSIVFQFLFYPNLGYAIYARFIIGAIGFACSALCVVIGIALAVKGLRMLIKP